MDWQSIRILFLKKLATRKGQVAFLDFCDTLPRAALNRLGVILWAVPEAQKPADDAHSQFESTMHKVCGLLNLFVQRLAERECEGSLVNAACGYKHLSHDAQRELAEVFKGVDDEWRALKLHACVS